MTAVDRTGIRLRVARGHWDLGEHSLALDCVETALEESGEPGAVRDLLAEMKAAVDRGEASASLLHRLRDLDHRLAAPSRRPDVPAEADDLPPLSTSTLAELLEAQGQRQKAVRVARDVLHRHPDDERARRILTRQMGQPFSPAAPGGRRSSGAVDPGGAHPQRDVLVALEGWLEYLRRRRAGGGSHP